MKENFVDLSFNDGNKISLQYHNDKQLGGIMFCIMTAYGESFLDNVKIFINDTYETNIDKYIKYCNGEVEENCEIPNNCIIIDHKGYKRYILANSDILEGIDKCKDIPQLFCKIIYTGFNKNFEKAIPSSQIN